MFNLGNDDKTVVVLSSINWDFLWQRHHVWVQGFLKAGYKVYFINNTGFRNPSLKDLTRIIDTLKNMLFRKSIKNNSHKIEFNDQNLHVISPMILPPNELLCRFLNKTIFIPRIIKRLKALGLPLNPDICLVYMPSFSNLKFIEQLNSKFTVFDACSNFRGHSEKPRDYEWIENKLIGLVDRIVTDSKYLFNIYKDSGKPIARMHQGVPDYMFNEIRSVRNIYKTGVFFGTIDDRVDFSILESLVKSGIEIQLYGVVKGDIKIPDGIASPKILKHQELANKLQEADFILIPYKMVDFNKGIEPAKIYESLATGLPILATPLPSLVDMNDYIYLCNSPSEFLKTVKNLYAYENNLRIRNRINLAKSYSTDKQFIRFEKFITDYLEEGSIENVN